MTDSIDDILAEAENEQFVRVATARVLLRQDLAARHEALAAQLDAANKGPVGMDTDERVRDLAQQLVDLEAEIDGCKREFKFRNIGKRAWADLLAKHPPTDKQRKADGRVDHNPETFPLAAIAAASHDPVMSAEQVERLEKSLTSTQFDMLWLKTVEANLGGVTDPKSRAAGLILGTNDESATTAANEESPDRSSLGG